MDYYKKKTVKNIILGILFIIGVALQFYGIKINSYTGLAIQFLSLTILIIVLFIYNKRFK